VCILLAGGNDSYNMLIPYDVPNHDDYINARNGLYTDPHGLAIPRSELAGTVLNYSDGSKQWAAHPSMTHVKNLFDDGRLAFLANVGTLVQPTTKQDYENEQHLPLGLFSHSDQIEQWQTGIPNERTGKGWGGKIADLINDCNPNQNISMNISLSGSNVYQTGEMTVEYAIDPYSGAVGMSGYDPESTWLTNQIRTRAIDSLIEYQYEDIFKKTYMKVVGDARDSFFEFQDALDQSITFQEEDFPDNYMGASLEMIARVIDVREILDFKRQIFFLVVGGWDHHDEVIDAQQGMLGMVSGALESFQNAMGPSQVNAEDEVLTMFISEFGRTLESNGNGSDHAWGGNVIVMGGPNMLNGGVIHGSYPSMLMGGANPLEVGRGRFIPTLSTDEYYAEVAKWFGVPGTDLTTIFPNLGYFYDPMSPNYPIGFLNP
jgi:uncharacterized protein (DUF1501 family)